MSNTKTETLQLISPYGGDPAIFNVQSDASIPEDTNEIIQIIKFISEENKDVKTILENYRINNKTNDLKSLKILCDSFNSWSKEMHLISAQQKEEKKRCSKKLIKYLMSLIYNRAVQEPGKLNQYEAFSPEVYGETGFDIIDQMLSRVPLNENDVFLDLGSGVGNVVLHVAAISQCKVCFGFEKAEWPAKYAELMEKEFVFWMNFFGKSYSEFRIYKADFLSDEEKMEVDNILNKSITNKRTVTINEYVKEIVNDAKLVFVNNYAFGAEVDHQLKLRFCNMTEGSFIISSKAFCPLNFRVNSRNLNDIGAMLNISEFEPLSGHVSWTDKTINYYFQKIDRTLLEKYFERRKNPKTNENNKKENSTEHHNEKSLKMNSPGSISSHSASSSSSSSSSSYASSASSPSSLSSESMSPLRNDENHSRRKRNKSKELKKRKATTSINSAESASPMRRLTKKKTLNSSIADNKKAEKSKLKSNSHKSLIRLRSKSLEKTLDKMHTNIKETSCPKPEATKLIQKNIVNGSNSSNRLQKPDNKLKNHTNFNLNSLTSLSNENLDKQLLKDCKISSTFYKQINNVRSLSANKNGVQKNSSTNIKNGTKLNESSIDFEDKYLRKELGDGIVNAVEIYFKKLKRNYFKYLLHLNSTEYKEKIQTQLKNEINMKSELHVQEEKLKFQTNALLKSNVNLLKMRASELGISDLKYPHELINYAQDILAEHQKLLSEIDNSEKIVRQLEVKHKDINGPKKHKNFDELKQNPKTTTILNKLLNVIEPKNTDSTNKKVINGNNTSSANKTSLLNEKENLNTNDLNMNQTKSPTEDIRSVGSATSATSSSTDGTITATERADEENDDLNNNPDTTDLSEDQSSPKNGEELISKTSKKQTISKPSSINMFMYKDSNKSDNLRNFKIPKQNLKDSSANKTNNSPSPPPDSFSSFSQTSPSSRKNSLEKLKNHNSNSHKEKTKMNDQLTLPSSQHGDSPISYAAILNSITTDYSSSSSSSPSISSTNTFDFGNQKSTNYYHPKKNQFRQYMMENSSSSSSSTNKNLITDCAQKMESIEHHSNSYNNQDIHTQHDWQSATHMSAETKN